MSILRNFGLDTKTQNGQRRRSPTSSHYGLYGARRRMSPTVVFCQRTSQFTAGTRRGSLLDWPDKKKMPRTAAGWTVKCRGYSHQSPSLTPTLSRRKREQLTDDLKKTGNRQKNSLAKTFGVDTLILVVHVSTRIAGDILSVDRRADWTNQRDASSPVVSRLCRSIRGSLPLRPLRRPGQEGEFLCRAR